MPVEIQVLGPASEMVMACEQALAQEGARAAAGRGVRRLLIVHLASLDADRPNALGGKRTHFYAQAARGVTYETDSDGVTVSIHQLGIAQRYYGGEIKPVNSKYLTIPVDPEAYGRRAGEFDNLSVQYGLGTSGKPRPMFLVQDNAYRFKTARNKATGATEVRSARWSAGKIMYYLALSVNQAPDPTVLPDQDLIRSAAVTAISRYLTAIQQRRSARTES